jgi:ABC-type molybdenum transport system ATPase subunit/photorepair protein PhrA
MQSYVVVVVGLVSARFAKSKHTKITSKKCVTSGIGTQIGTMMTMTIEQRLERIESMLRHIIRELSYVPTEEELQQEKSIGKVSFDLIQGGK